MDQWTHDESPSSVPPTPRWATVMMRVLAGALYAIAAAMYVLQVALVLLENGDFGPPPLSDALTVLWSAAAMIACNLLFPWAATHLPMMPSYRHPSELHASAAVCAVMSMLAYMLIIDPAGGRREVLSVALPAVLLPAGLLLAWRALQIGAAAVGNPPRDVSDWSAADHLRGRR